MKKESPFMMPFVPSVVLDDFDRSFSLREAATQTARLLTHKQA